MLLCLCNQTVTHAQTNRIEITVDTRRVYQAMENFGASDAWAGQFVGHWPQQKKDSIADWLFSLDTMKDGSPKGIGLSLWRFNLGAGSTQQGEESGIKDEWRRAESLLSPSGKIDPSLQSGQQWFLQAAKKRKVPQFLAFLNSPPVQFTANRRSFAAKAGESNLEPAAFDKAAEYIASAVKQLEVKNGISFNYISPVNEPQWDWSDGGQEGNPYTNTGIAGFARSLDAAIAKQQLSAKILLAEAGHIRYLLNDDDKPGKGNQVKDLFTPGSANYIGNLKSVAPVIAAHSYFSTSPFQRSLENRQRVAEAVAAVKGLSYWQSEYCILGDNDGEISGGKRDTGMVSALYVAKVIYADLVAANASAWQWWLAISPYDYKDGLVYVDKNKTDGNYTDSKMMWALGNYSRFVRPGMKRIEAKSNDDRCLVAAFTGAQNKLVFVFTNISNESLNIDLEIPPTTKYKKINTYITSQDKKLQKQPVKDLISLEPQSITTLVME